MQNITITLKLMAISIVINQRLIKHNSVISRSEFLPEYDYIVVGAGSAGCAVAARLAEDSNKYVILLEAGGPQTLDTDMAANVDQLFGSKYDWQYSIVEQKIMKSSYLILPRGRVFGGSSGINGMNYYRGSPEDFNIWESEYGIKNWTYSDLLEYFMRSENNLDKNKVLDESDNHVTGGPLSVSTAEADIMLKNYAKAANLMGYNETFSDGRNPFGYTLMQRTIKGGVRQSSATAFLESDPKPNLHTFGNSTVIKILFDENKRAIGVNFILNNVIQTVYARNEVIVSAGAIGSPQLLMLSGIGPKQHLEDMNITVISDLRVGDNLGTCYMNGFYYSIRNSTAIEPPINDTENQYKFYVQETGPLGYIAHIIHCFKEIYYDKYPEVSNGCILLRTLPSKYGSFASFVSGAIVRKPKSRGTVRLASNDPLVRPLIDPCVYCDPSDIDSMVQIMKMNIKVFSDPYLLQYLEPHKYAIPGCTPCKDDFYCDSYLRCWALTHNDGVYPMGTCKMGSDDDDSAVVDTTLKVKGVNCLRVIDSSILPDVSEQTNAISMMIGEKGAQLVKDSAKKVEYCYN